MRRGDRLAGRHGAALRGDRHGRDHDLEDETARPAAHRAGPYVAAAEKKGIPRKALGGTLQADILKEYIAQKEWIFPPRPHVRIIVDMMKFCTEQMPKWNTISISGYHIREAGSTAVQELAFTLADGFAYVEAAVKAGMDVDSFAPRLSLFLQLADRLLRGDLQVPGCAPHLRAPHAREIRGQGSAFVAAAFPHPDGGLQRDRCTAAQNIVRVAFEAMAAALGGTQSLHTNSMDEVLALPGERAVEVALRTQQVLAFETNVTNVVDPLGGSYFVEALTDRWKSKPKNTSGGSRKSTAAVEAIEAGFFQKEIADASYRYQRSLETKDRVIVGVNSFEREGSEKDIDLLKIDRTVEVEQVKRVKEVRARRRRKVEVALAALKRACADNRST